MPVPGRPMEPGRRPARRGRQEKSAAREQMSIFVTLPDGEVIEFHEKASRQELASIDKMLRAKDEMAFGFLVKRLLKRGDKRAFKLIEFGDLKNAKIIAFRAFGSPRKISTRAKTEYQIAESLMKKIMANARAARGKKPEARGTWDGGRAKTIARKEIEIVTMELVNPKTGQKIMYDLGVPENADERYEFLESIKKKELAIQGLENFRIISHFITAVSIPDLLRKAESAQGEYFPAKVIQQLQETLEAKKRKLN